MNLRSRRVRPRSNSTPGQAAPSPRLPPSISRAKTTSNAPSSLLSQADALARMTLELNLRAVTNQAERLERDVKTLVLSTADDKAFRAANEARMESIYREITAVKQRMEEHKTDRTDLKQLVDETVDGMRTEMVNMKTSLEDLSELLNTLPSMYGSQGVRSKSDAPTASVPQQLAIRSKTSPSADDRIREALNSTRRWNREHKTTSLEDSAFVALYLRKQLKRDAKMAVFIQRSIKKRVRPRLDKAPSSLDEFCSDVTWQDVKAAVEDVLVRDTSAVMQLLRTP